MQGRFKRMAKVNAGTADATEQVKGKWSLRNAAKLHGWLVKPLFVLWWVAFISGEIFYIVLYLL
jgi:hypothetical protein